MEPVDAISSKDHHVISLDLVRMLGQSKVSAWRVGPISMTMIDPTVTISSGVQGEDPALRGVMLWSLE